MPVFQQNIQLSAPIMSRFDLFFVLVDECNEVTDYAIARRIVDLHTREEESVEREYSLVGTFLFFLPQSRKNTGINLRYKTYF